MSTPPDGLMLALDSSTAMGSVAVGEGDRLLAEATLGVAGGASATLLPAVDAALRAAGLTPGDLRAVVVAGGPGSFTGVRIAAATAKGIVHARGIPLYRYSGLLAAAAAFAPAARPICAMFDARRRDVYAACYDFREGGVTEIFAPEALTLDALIERVRGIGGVLCTGDGATAHAAELAQAAADVVPGVLAAPRAAALLWLARTVPALGLIADAQAWEPEYLRASGAERIAAARAAAVPA